jgi:hypothetical protein
MTDIDIDLRVNFDPKKLFKEAVPASKVQDSELKKHPCGHYFQTIPVDAVTGLAAIPYEEAEMLGYFKFDFLHLAALDAFPSKDEMRKLIKQSPDWTLLLDEENVLKLFQISKRADLLKRIQPKSVQELADCIALMRPSKIRLTDAYLVDKEKIRPLLYRQGTDDKSSFRRSHALAYALTIVIQLHLLAQDKL